MQVVMGSCSGSFRFTQQARGGAVHITHRCEHPKKQQQCYSYPAKAFHVLHEEAIRIVPRQEDVFDDVFDALLLESQSLRLHNWRVDQIQPTQITRITIEIITSTYINIIDR